MNSSQRRPVFLDLTKLKFPLPAIVSILHRISGIVIFLSLPLWLWMLSQSLRSQQSFAQLQQQITQPFFKIILFLASAAIIYHVVAGIRHLIMDLGFAETLKGGRIAAWTALLVSIVLVILVGVCIW